MCRVVVNRWYSATRPLSLSLFLTNVDDAVGEQSRDNPSRTTCIDTIVFFMSVTREAFKQRRGISVCSSASWAIVSMSVQMLSKERRAWPWMTCNSDEPAIAWPAIVSLPSPRVKKAPRNSSYWNPTLLLQHAYSTRGAKGELLFLVRTNGFWSRRQKVACPLPRATSIIS